MRFEPKGFFSRFVYNGSVKAFPYIGILGRQPELGLVELESQLGADALEPYGRQAVRLDQMIDVNRFGGVVRVAKVLYDGRAADIRPVPVDTAVLPVSGSKTPFTISVYGIKATRRFVETAGIALKQILRQRGAVRFIVPGEGLVASTAQLKYNQVLERGFELVVVVSGQQMIVAQTLGIQDIDWYGHRDYERPARSASVGMLPPKLAQVLVNTTAAPVVVDPFCGTGVVLQEALLLGRAARGSDLAPEMVAATQANLEWLEREVAPAVLPEWQVARADARTVRVPAVEAAIVSEGYLGPHLSTPPSLDQLRQLLRAELELYREVLANWSHRLERGAELALCVPAWRTTKGWRYLGLVDELSPLGYTMKVFKHVPQPLLYARPDQIVGRQLLLLRKH